MSPPVPLEPGQRTPVRHGWGAGAGAAITSVVGDPVAWLLGLTGFLARGGVLLLTLPILSVPSPVLLSMLFRGEVGAIGRGEVRLMAIAVGLVVSAVVIAGVVVSAWADLALAERLVADAETEELRLGRRPRRLTPPERRSLLWWIASVQAVALVPLIVAVTIALDAIVRTTAGELTSPSGTGPLVTRVLPAVVDELLLVAAVLVLVDIGAGLAGRRLMAAAWGVLPVAPAHGRESLLALGALARAARQPGRVIATALAGWLVVGLTLGVVVLASLLAWAAARDVLIAGGSAPDAAVTVVAGALVGLFTLVWLGGLGLVGCASGVRAGLWTADALR